MKNATFGLLAASVLAAAPAFAGPGAVASSTSAAGSASSANVVGTGSARSWSMAGNASGAQATGYVTQANQFKGSVSTYSNGGAMTGSHVWGAGGTAGANAGQSGAAAAVTGH